MSKGIKNENAYTIKTLLRLDLKSRFGYGSRIGGKKIGKWIANFIFSALIYSIVVIGIYFLTKMFTSREELCDSYLVLASMFSIIIQLFICTGTLVKALYFSGDNEMLLRFPVNGTQIFVAKSIYVMINNLLITASILLPLYISYGVLLDLGFGFFIWACFVTLMSSLLPFFIANIIAIPIMLLVNAVKDKFGIILGVLIVVICLCFAFYMIILRTILDYLQTRELSLFSPDVIASINNFAKYAFPFNMYGNLLLGRKIGLSLLYTFLLTAGCGVIAYLIVKKWYFKTILDGIESQRSAFTKKTKTRNLPVFWALMRREFLNIFRSFNYSFQYLAMAIAAPVMVYFCNDLASVVGVESVGERILPGLTLLVVTIFVTLIVSFSSSAISREGNNFYHTKIIPVSYSYQVFVKFIFYITIATLSIIASCLVVLFAKFVSFNNSVFIFFITEFVAITLTAICMRVDSRTPSFNVSGDGEIVATNKNMTLSLVLGLFLAMLFGITSMVFSYLPSIFGIPIKNGITSVFWWLLLLTGVMAVISVSLLFINLNKRYNKIIA